MLRVTTRLLLLCLTLLAARPAMAAIIYESPNGRTGLVLIDSSETAAVMDNELDSNFDGDVSQSIPGNPGVTMHATNTYTFGPAGFSGISSAYASLISTQGGFASAQSNIGVHWTVDAPQTLYLWGNLDYRLATTVMTLKAGAVTIFSEIHNTAENDQTPFLFSWPAVPGTVYHLTSGIASIDQNGAEGFVYSNAEINVGPVVPEPSTFVLAAAILPVLYRMRCRRRRS